MSENLILTIIITLGTVLGGQGFWQWIISKRIKKKGGTNSDKMVKGLAHDRIDYLGRQYVTRGYMTFDEFENLVKYLYIPYRAENGNGYIEALIENKVKLLPLFETHEEGKLYLVENIKNKGVRNND